MWQPQTTVKHGLEQGSRCLPIEQGSRLSAKEFLGGERKTLQPSNIGCAQEKEDTTYESATSKKTLVKTLDWIFSIFVAL